MAAENTKGRGGKREGAGRRARNGATHLIRRNATLTAEQAKKFYILGGSLWLRAMIDRELDNE